MTEVELRLMWLLALSLEEGATVKEWGAFWKLEKARNRFSL